MAGDATAVPRRRWHPLTIASGVAVAAFGAAGVGLAVGARAGWWFPLAAWLLVGTAAGFATSGST